MSMGFDGETEFFYFCQGIRLGGGGGRGVDVVVRNLEFCL